MNRSDQFRFYGALLCFCTIVLFLYWPVIHGELVWDDQNIVYKYNLMNMDEWFYNSFQRSYLADSYYRPLPLLTMMWNGMLGAKHYTVFAHATNVFIFCLNIFLVMQLCYKTSAKPLITSLLAGGLYIANPALMESTAWISGRCDLLVTFFVLLALFVETGLKEQFGLKVILVSICFFCAALSKEMAMVFPFILLMWKLTTENIRPGNLQQLWAINNKENRIYAITLLATGLCYLLFRYAMLGHVFSNGPATRYQYSGDYLSHFLLVMKTYTWYLLLQVFSHFELSALYTTNIPVLINDRAALIGVILVIATIFLFISKRINDKIKYGALVITLLFIPVSNIIRLNLWDNFIHLRFLTLPITCLMIFFMPLLVDWLAIQRKQLQLVFTTTGVIWCLTGIANLYITIPLWSNQLLLWKWATQTAPHSRIAWGNYTSALANSGNLAGCIAAFEESRKFQVFDPRVYINAGICHDALGNKDQSRLIVQQLLQTPSLDTDVNTATLTLAAKLNIDKVMADGHLPGIDSFEYKNIVTLLRNAIVADNTNLEAKYLLVLWYTLNNDQPSLDTFINEIFNQTTVKKMAFTENIKKYAYAKKMLNDAQWLYLDSVLATHNNNSAGNH